MAGEKHGGGFENYAEHSNTIATTQKEIQGVKDQYLFSREMEDEFAQHIKHMETRFFSLTLKYLKKLIFEILTKNNFKNPFNV